jgi:hypothetical protein
VLSDLSWIFDGAGTAAVAALSGMGARAAVRYWKPRYSCRARTTVYTAGPESHMADYRARLDEVVAAARHNVYFSGPGFGPSSKGEKAALTCVAAIRSAFQRGIRVVRVQTTPHAHEFWMNQLKALLGEVPDLLSCGCSWSRRRRRWPGCAPSTWTTPRAASLSS